MLALPACHSSVLVMRRAAESAAWHLAGFLSPLIFKWISQYSFSRAASSSCCHLRCLGDEPHFIPSCPPSFHPPPSSWRTHLGIQIWTRHPPSKPFRVFVVQSLSRVWLFVTPWTAACQASLSFTISRSLLKLHVHRVSDAIQPSRPLSSPFPPAFNLSQHQGLS